MASQSFQLVMQKGPNPGKIFELAQEEATIGRDISNRIVINDPEVSRRHARLTLADPAVMSSKTWARPMARSWMGSV